jgi:hypothetical protein
MIGETIFQEAAIEAAPGAQNQMAVVQAEFSRGAEIVYFDRALDHFEGSFERAKSIAEAFSRCGL